MKYTLKDIAEFVENHIIPPTRFTAPEPEPACKQNQEWMLEKIKETE